MQRKSQSKGRDREATRIRKLTRAAAVGRLMLGEFNDWEEFLRPDLQDFASMPRRELRALDSHTRRFLKSELKRFCDRNFEDMTPEALSDLFEDIKVHRGLEPVPSLTGHHKKRSN